MPSREDQVQPVRHANCSSSLSNSFTFVYLKNMNQLRGHSTSRGQYFALTSAPLSAREQPNGDDYDDDDEEQAWEGVRNANAGLDLTDLEIKSFEYVL